MARTTKTDEHTPLGALLATGEHAPTVESKVQMAQAFRARRPEQSAHLDHALLDRLARYDATLRLTQKAQAELEAIIARLEAVPWHPALFMRLMSTAAGERALVLYAGQRRLVALAQEVDPGSLRPGDEVFLGSDLNVINARSPHGPPPYGETAFFERLTGDRRCVLRWRDEEIIVEAGAGLMPAALQKGDQVRWDRSAWMALEKIEGDKGEHLFLSEVPTVGREHVGGQDGNLDVLLSALTASLLAPEKAARYGLGDGRKSILMVGPSGVGKTLMARVAAAEITRASASPCRFAVVKPAAWESPWVGETERNIRSYFKALRDAAAQGPAVVFLDEIEAVGRIRGGIGSHHGDRFLAALLAEIDGFSERSGVAIIAATNRKDLIDPALLERLSDVEISVGRPDMRGARAIFGIHLPESFPYHGNGSSADEVRCAMIESAVSRLYAPNAENELCTIRLRDGKTRTVSARELTSGRLIDQICRAARHSAFRRDLQTDDPGLRDSDLVGAVSDALERLTTTLTPRNAHAYLTDLPQDVDVVSVEPLQRKVPRPHRYLTAV
jgi:proteasome ATPase